MTIRTQEELLTQLTDGTLETGGLIDVAKLRTWLKDLADTAEDRWGAGDLATSPAVSPALSEAYARIEGLLADCPVGTEGVDFDPLWSEVALLLHMEGADASTTFTDSSTNGFTPTQVNDQAQIDTAQKKFGVSSGLFQGNSDRVEFTDATFQNINAGSDWTFEGFLRRSATGVYHAIAGSGSIFSGIHRTSFQVFSDDRISYFDTRTTPETSFIKGTTTLAAATWYHFAYVKEGNEIRIYLDGNLEATGNQTSGKSASNLFAISLNCGPSPSYMNGHLDELRLTIGTARYDGNFTPPAAPYPETETNPLVGDATGCISPADLRGAIDPIIEIIFPGT